jgi:Uma2 family endonuclease
MATAPTKLMTADEFFDWANDPDNRDKYCELERGEIVEMTKPGKRHGFVCTNVAAIFRDYTVKRKKGYVCSNDTGMVVEREPDTVRGPDVSLYEDAESYEQLELRWSETPARVTVEVLSPTDSMGRVMRRVGEQLRFGVKAVLVIDPEARNVTVHRPGQEPIVLEENQEVVIEDVLPEFRCRVADFFAWPGA